MLVNRREIFYFKADNKNINFPTQFCLRIISNGFSTTEPREVTLNGNVYVKQVSIVLLSFSSSLATRCLPLNDEPCMVKSFLLI